MAKITFLNIFVFIMELFYTNNIDGNRAILPEQESIHCARVLRHKLGDIINFTDGKGYLYSGKLLEKIGKELSVQILSREKGVDSRPYFLHMAVALTKNIDRFEWFLEKAVEVGVDRITPLICEHSERRVFKYERANRLILSAAKQSLKTLFPILDEAVKVIDFIESQPNFEDNSLKENVYRNNVLKIMGHCREGEKETITSILKNAKLDKPHIIIMVGPEGDFSLEEIEFALKKEFKVMHLGNSRMRVETAAVTALNAVYLNYLDSSK